MLHQDIRIREFIREKLQHAGVPRVEIERSGNKVKVNIYTARPGIVIGKKGAEIDKLKKEVQQIARCDTFLEIHEIRRRFFAKRPLEGRVRRRAIVRNATGRRS